MTSLKLWKASLQKLVALSLVATASVGQSAYARTADQILEYLAENWQWSGYWFGKTGIDDVYVEGRRISALVFWTKSGVAAEAQGLCSAELSLCVAYGSRYLDPHGRRTPIVPSASATQTLQSWIAQGLPDQSFLVNRERLPLGEFEIEQRPFVLPRLIPPRSIISRKIPPGAFSEAQRIKGMFGCKGIRAPTRSESCRGSLVFARFGVRDPYWFVLRSCGRTCGRRGDSVEFLRRGDFGWEVTAGGYLGSPKRELEKMKRRIERAAMFRIPL